MHIRFKTIIAGFLILTTALLISCSKVGTPAGPPWPGFSQPSEMPASVEKPTKIVLLVPLHGKLASSGQAIRNGFLAAYYFDKQQQGAPSISVTDTSAKPVQELYQQAIAQGANFIVGPLTKKNVQSIADLSHLNTPTLALNTLDNLDYTVPNLYQFGLSPIDEAIQTASRAREDDHNTALIIAPAGSWGQNIANAFMQRWEYLGGKVAGTLAYQSRKTLPNEIQTLLDIKSSNHRASEIKATLKEKVRFIPQRREDADMIFLVASSLQARTIRPLLKFYYAGNLPVYAISTIYNGMPNPARDRDLEGVTFCDMPWVLYKNNQLTTRLETIRQRIMTLWPDSYRRYPKLYGLGIDAYALTTQLNELVSNPRIGIPGATGILYIQGYLRIFRQCAWARFVRGKPQLLQ